MAKRRHGGLGRGLDALIPQTRREESGREESEKIELKNTAVGPEKPADGISKSEPVEGGPAESYGAAAGFSGTSEQTGGRASAAGAAAGSMTDSSALSAAGEGSSGGAQAGRDSTGRDSTGRDSAGGDSAGRDSAGGDPEGMESADRDSSGGISSGDFLSGGVEAGDDRSGVRMLRLSQIDPNRSQPRQKFEDESLEELAGSIRQFGVLQPILVQKKGSRYEIIAGERRWRASRKAGLTEIPAIVREYSSQETLELSLIENIQREDLNPIEEAKAFQRLLEEFHLRQEDLAARVSKSRTAITNSVRLLKLDERVQDMIVQGDISMGHARALIPVEIPDEQYLIAQQVSEKQLSVREVEKLIKARLSGKGRKKNPKKDKGIENDPALELAYRAIEERLKQSLGTKTTIRHSGDGTGRLEIEFYSHEDLEKIVDLLT